MDLNILRTLYIPLAKLPKIGVAHMEGSMRVEIAGIIIEQWNTKNRASNISGGCNIERCEGLVIVSHNVYFATRMLFNWVQSNYLPAGDRQRRYCYLTLII